MFNNNGYSLSDIAAVTGENGFNGNGGAWWIIILFLFCFMGWGGNGFNRGNMPPMNPAGAPATAGEVQNQFNFAALERQNNEIIEAIRQGVYDTTGAVKDMDYANNNSIRDVESMVQANGYELGKGFCNMAQAIDGVKYDSLLNTQNIMHNDCQNTQKILDAIAGNRIADMQNQINTLQLQAALCGVVRYPQATTYTAGYAPFIGNPSPCCGANY